jgi:hypothetical protein
MLSYASDLFVSGLMSDIILPWLYDPVIGKIGYFKNSFTICVNSLGISDES